jgi:integrase
VRSKTEAAAILDRMRDAVRAGTFAKKEAEPLEERLTFNRFADLYIERYVKASHLASAGTIDYRMSLLRKHLGKKLLTDIKTADIEDFVARLKEPCRLAAAQKSLRVRTPATINRYLSLLRHMFNWAVGREYLDRTPFRRGTQTLVRQELEDNRRHRRVSKDEEQRLLEHAPDYLRPLLVLGLDAGLRRGEMLAMTWADVDARPGWLRLRGETTKSGKTRWVPVATARLKAVLDYLRREADGSTKPADAPVCSYETGEAIGLFRTAWILTVLRAHGFTPSWVRGRGSGSLSRRGVVRAPTSSTTVSVHVVVDGVRRADAIVQEGSALTISVAERGKIRLVPWRSADSLMLKLVVVARAEGGETEEEMGWVELVQGSETSITVELLSIVVFRDRVRRLVF